MINLLKHTDRVHDNLINFYMRITAQIKGLKVPVDGCTPVAAAHISQVQHEEHVGGWATHHQTSCSGFSSVYCGRLLSRVAFNSPFLLLVLGFLIHRADNDGSMALSMNSAAFRRDETKERCIFF